MTTNPPRTDPETLALRKAEMKRANGLIVHRTNRRWVADQLGISYGSLNQLAYGHASIHPTFKAKVAAFLDLPIEDVFPHGAERV
jgi:hypothetical protein